MNQFPVTKLMDRLIGSENGDVALGDRKNMVYMGSAVVYGKRQGRGCRNRNADEMAR